MKNTMKTPLLILPTALLAALFIASCGGEPEPSEVGAGGAPGDGEAVDAGPSDESLLQLPVRFHILQSVEPEIDAQMTDEDVNDLVIGANDVWSIADIAFEVEDIRRVTAANTDVFLAAAESGEKGPESLAAMSAVIPEQGLLAPGWNVVVVQSMINLPPGVYLHADLTVLVAFEIPNGSPLPAGTLAHELGHSLGLQHVDGNDSYNVMASGPGTAPAAERTELSAEQIEAARAQAEAGVPAG